MQKKYTLSWYLAKAEKWRNPSKVAIRALSQEYSVHSILITSNERTWYEHVHTKLYLRYLIGKFWKGNQVIGGQKEKLSIRLKV